MAIANSSIKPEQSGAATILIVDDEEAVRKLAARMLLRSGYTVLDAPGGKEALELCAQREGIHLLITDLTMPGLSGFELAERVQERWPELKILFMTGYANDHGLGRETSTGTGKRGTAQRPLLEKPFTAEELCAKVRELLGQAVPSSGHLTAP